MYQSFYLVIVWGHFYQDGTYNCMEMKSMELFYVEQVEIKALSVKLGKSSLNLKNTELVAARQVN